MNAPSHAPLAVNDPVKLAAFLRACSGILLAGGQVLTQSEATTLAELISSAMGRGPVAMTPEMNMGMVTLLSGLADGLDGGRR